MKHDDSSNKELERVSSIKNPNKFEIIRNILSGKRRSRKELQKTRYGPFDTISGTLTETMVPTLVKEDDEINTLRIY